MVSFIQRSKGIWELLKISASVFYQGIRPLKRLMISTTHHRHLWRRWPKQLSEITLKNDCPLIFSDKHSGLPTAIVGGLWQPDIFLPKCGFCLKVYILRNHMTTFAKPFQISENGLSHSNIHKCYIRKDAIYLSVSDMRCCCTFVSSTSPTTPWKRLS